MLFEINKSTKHNTSVHCIASEHVELHSDMGRSILYTGLNESGGRIVGHLICEDDEVEVSRYAHIVISPAEYESLLSSQITYRQLIENQDCVYLIDFDEDKGKEVATCCVHPSTIPSEYLPTTTFLFSEVLAVEYDPLVNQ